jgi:hypothetical protein
LRPQRSRSPDRALVKSLARAWRWQRMLDECLYTSISEIGGAENMLATRQNQIEADLPRGARIPTGDPNRAQRSRPGRKGRARLRYSQVLL